MYYAADFNTTVGQFTIKQEVAGAANSSDGGFNSVAAVMEMIRSRDFQNVGARKCPESFWIFRDIVHRLCQERLVAQTSLFAILILSVDEYRLHIPHGNGGEEVAEHAIYLFVRSSRRVLYLYTTADFADVVGQLLLPFNFNRLSAV